MNPFMQEEPSSGAADLANLASINKLKDQMTEINQKYNELNKRFTHFQNSTSNSLD